MSRASSAWFIISRFLKNEIHVVNECPKILWKVQGNLCVIISYINNEILIVTADNDGALLSWNVYPTKVL